MRAEARLDEGVLFEERVRPRRLLSLVWSALALAILVLSVVGLAGSALLSVIGAVSLALLALKEWNRVVLRVSEDAVVHQAPSWMSGLAVSLSVARAGRRIAARDVAGVDWSGHDNVGIRLRDGRVETVFFRHRVAPARQALARDAILAFVERATGSAEPPQPEVASWLRRRASP